MLTFTRLGALEVVSPPPYVFLIGGFLSPFSNYTLLMASFTLVPQSHKVWSWEGAGHPKLSNPKVGFSSLFLMS